MDYGELKLERTKLVMKWVWRSIALALGLIVAGMAGCPVYSVWERGLAGKSELKQAEWNRQIKIQEAEATQAAAKHLAQAEVERAKGVAQANKIIGASLKENEEYLRWLWIEAMKEKDDKTIVYIPTEANLPILEANRFKVNK